MTDVRRHAYMDSHTFRPTLEIVEIEGHGRYFEVSDSGRHVGTFDHPNEICRTFAGRIALVYGYAAYEAACLANQRAHPDDWDDSDIVPAPVLVMVRPPLVRGECRWCHRVIVWDGNVERWVDPEATGDDGIWYETCDAHDTFIAEHELGRELRRV